VREGENSISPTGFDPNERHPVELLVAAQCDRDVPIPCPVNRSVLDRGANADTPQEKTYVLGEPTRLRAVGDVG
jgi:hypothetical protein